MQAKTKAFIRRLHKWLGLAVGVQVMLWMLSGVYMSLVPIETVRGRDMASAGVPHLSELPNTLFHVEQLLKKHALSTPNKVELVKWQHSWVYRWFGDDQALMFDAQNGELLSPLTSESIKAIALADYAGEGQLIHTVLLTELPWEVASRAKPLWQATFDDLRGTRLYIDPDLGTVVARRNTQWRIFDLLWRLHIMDYTEGEDFNNPLLISFALTSLLFAFSGLMLVVISFHRRNFGLKPRVR
ncbi:hypothetical protein ACFSJ3_09105 [Corallincola platygyrae]|uniref:PepSY domain-containing protein n=1 Tax=Corallincola platygyrae TaxID=1193278 RepID=A0ABW4XQ31_9GAMM